MIHDAQYIVCRNTHSRVHVDTSTVHVSAIRGHTTFMGSEKKLLTMRFPFCDDNVHRQVWYYPVVMGRVCEHELVKHNAHLDYFLNKNRTVSSIWAQLLTSPFSLLVYLYCLQQYKCTEWYDAALFGVAFELFDLGLNIGHSFFEKRSFYLPLIHRVYHIISFTTIGITLTTVQ